MGEKEARHYHGTPIDEIGMYVVRMLGQYEKPMGKTRIHKTLFILTKDVTRLAAAFDFRPDDFGPYSMALELCLQKLRRDGFVDYDDDAKYGKPVSLTGAGKNAYVTHAANIDKDVAERLPVYIELFEDLGHNEMLAFVDSMFPEMAVKSKKYNDHIKPNLDKYIVQLIKKEKITTGRGAELLQIPYSEMRRIVKN